MMATKMHMRYNAVENNNLKFHPTPTLDDNRNQPAMNSIHNYTQGDVQMSLPTLDLPNSSENREESQTVEALDSTLEQTVNNAPIAPTALVYQRKSTRENLAKPSNRYNEFYM